MSEGKSFIIGRAVVPATSILLFQPEGYGERIWNVTLVNSRTFALSMDNERDRNTIQELKGYFGVPADFPQPKKQPDPIPGKGFHAVA